MKKSKMRCFAVILTAAMTGCFLAGCGGTPSGTQKTEGQTEAAQERVTDAKSDASEKVYPSMQIDMACNNSNSPDESLLLKFAELVEERSSGSVTAVVFAGTLGSELEIDEQIRSGTVHMYVSATSTISTYAPDYNTFSVPYVY